MRLTSGQKQEAEEVSALLSSSRTFTSSLLRVRPWPICLVQIWRQTTKVVHDSSRSRSPFMQLCLWFVNLWLVRPASPRIATAALPGPRFTQPIPPAFCHKPSDTRTTLARKMTAKSDKCHIQTVCKRYRPLGLRQLCAPSPIPGKPPRLASKNPLNPPLVLIPATSK